MVTKVFNPRTFRIEAGISRFQGGLGNIENSSSTGLHENLSQGESAGKRTDIVPHIYNHNTHIAR